MYGTDSLKYAFSCKNLRGFCSCVDNDQCVCMMKGGCSKCDLTQETDQTALMNSSLARIGEEAGQEDGQGGYTSDFDLGVGMVMTTDDEGGD